MGCAEQWCWCWRWHVRSQVFSGLSQVVYCRIYGIPLATFAHWRCERWAEQLPPLTLVQVVSNEAGAH